MPIVDDPFDFGAIAATNAISDVYAMGGTPLFALALVGMPVNQIPLEVIRKILEGGESVCARAGIPIAGGHTIDSVEPIYGLVAIGLVDPKNLKRNAGARAGDKLDPRQAARRRHHQRGAEERQARRRRLQGDDRRDHASSTRRARSSARIDGVHALTDVTGFGLLGHLLEIAKGSNAVGASSTGPRFRCFPARSNSRARELPRAHRVVTGRATESASRWAARIGRGGKGPPHRSADERRTARRVRAVGRATKCWRFSASEGFDHAAVVGEIVERPWTRASRLNAACGRGRRHHEGTVRRHHLPPARSTRSAIAFAPCAKSRARSPRRCRAEDCAIQSMPDASPVKWHLAHTTWFFETFVLEPRRSPATRRSIRPSACSSIRTTTPSATSIRARSAACSRARRWTRCSPTARTSTTAMLALLAARTRSTRELAALVELGLQHEQQHQELILTDVKHLLSCNPLQPVVSASAGRSRRSSRARARWIAFAGGLQRDRPRRRRLLLRQRDAAPPRVARRRSRSPRSR